VYSAAVQNGYPPSYIIDDSPLSVPQASGKNWEPQNFDFKFDGPTPMRRGLYMSRNIVAIKMGQQLGEQTVINEARNFGITTPIPAVPSIFIGAAGVIPLQLVSAYGTFSTLGVHVEPSPILRVENANHQVIWRPTPSRTRVLSPEEGWIMVSMLKDVIQRGTAHSSVWSAGFHVPAGGKTGTTNDGTNVWFMGFTADLVAGVWMGFDHPQTIKSNAQGGILAAPAWTAFMTEVYHRKPTPPDWPMPPDITTREIDARNGLLYTPACIGDPLVTEYFVPGTEPVNECAPYTGYPPAGTPGVYPSPGTPAVPRPPGFTPPPPPIDTSRRVPRPPRGIEPATRP
jgi:penicillin-binding protein 1A